MNKKIADYLPYYIGQDCMIGDYKGKIQSVGSEEIDVRSLIIGIAIGIDIVLLIYIIHHYATN